MRDAQDRRTDHVRLVSFAHARIHACTHMHAHTLAHTHTHSHTHSLTDTPIRTHSRTLTSVHTHTYAQMHACPRGRANAAARLGSRRIAMFPLRPFPLRPVPLRPVPLRPFPLRPFPLRPVPLRPVPLRFATESRMFPLRIALLGKTGADYYRWGRLWGVLFASSLSPGSKSRRNPPWQRTQGLWGGRQAATRQGYSEGTLSSTLGYSGGTLRVF
jgi:hypothetical protein